jgi:lysophospholipase L1-like esterase
VKYHQAYNGRVRKAAAAAIISAGAVVAALSACGASQPHPAVNGAAYALSSRGGNYLALGDSIAFGYRPPQVTPSADYLDQADFTGYPSVVADELRLTLVNASCPGETTASMISTTARSNGCENSPGSGAGYREIYPLHVAYSGSQLAFAVRFLEQNPAVKLVTLGIGLNDLNLCLDTGQCAGTVLQQTLARVGSNLHTILAALRDTAHYHGNLVVVTYYAPDYRDVTGTGQIKALDAVLSRQGELFGARIASGFAAFEAASASAGGNTCAAGLRIRVPGGRCDEHPSILGRDTLASAVVAVVRLCLTGNCDLVPLPAGPVR